jgi:CRISPR system Cascade subunit CasA
MRESSETLPSFNLWTEPWIVLESADGKIERHGIEETLLCAPDLRSIYDPSPLVVVGIHRLLVAVMQAALNPQTNADLKRLWRDGRFPAQAVRDFGGKHAERFDLFSEEAPFLQSADLPLQPRKGDKTKTIAYLAPEMPAGTAVTHYRHGKEDNQTFCLACAARGLVTIPPFATSGGQGIKPSINGVPPIYVLPSGSTLFESLAASLLLPNFQPGVRSKKKDDAWWDRPARVERGKEIRSVGYLHSLTFPARRVRLHPERVNDFCTRCGQRTEWGVRSMIFEMGECRPKEAEPWFDPFAAYRIRENKPPIPIRPLLGRAIWREYAALFLQQLRKQGGRAGDTFRPSVLEQIADLELEAETATWLFRCVGLRTDMKAKVFEWIDAGFDVPSALLRDEKGGQMAREAIEFAGECAKIMSVTFRQYLRGGTKSEYHRTLRTRMAETYWATLAGPFRQFVLTVALPDDPARAAREWADQVERQANHAFAQATEAVGNDATSLRQSETGKKWCSIRLAIQRKEYLHE